MRSRHMGQTHSSCQISFSSISVSSSPSARTSSWPQRGHRDEMNAGFFPALGSAGLRGRLFSMASSGVCEREERATADPLPVSVRSSRGRLTRSTSFSRKGARRCASARPSTRSAGRSRDGRGCVRGRRTGCLAARFPSTSTLCTDSRGGIWRQALTRPLAERQGQTEQRPSAGCIATVSRPPYTRAISALIQRPIPLPRWPFVLKNGSKMRSRKAAGTRRPLSATSTRASHARQVAEVAPQSDGRAEPWAEQHQRAVDLDVQLNLALVAFREARAASHRLEDRSHPPQCCLGAAELSFGSGHKVLSELPHSRARHDVRTRRA
jgi:hypothetical protein